LGGGGGCRTREGEGWDLRRAEWKGGGRGGAALGRRGAPSACFAPDAPNAQNLQTRLQQRPKRPAKPPKTARNHPKPPKTAQNRPPQRTPRCPSPSPPATPTRRRWRPPFRRRPRRWAPPSSRCGWGGRACGRGAGGARSWRPRVRKGGGEGGRPAGGWAGRPCGLWERANVAAAERGGHEWLFSNRPSLPALCQPGIFQPGPLPAPAPAPSCPPLPKPPHPTPRPAPAKTAPQTPNAQNPTPRGHRLPSRDAAGWWVEFSKRDLSSEKRI
jgi:hypothetical protein